MGAKDQISYPFNLVTNHHKNQNKNTTGSSPPNPYPISASKGDSSTPSQAEKLSEPAANSFATTGSMLSSAQPISDREILFTDTFGNSNLPLDNKSHDADNESLKIPIRQNLHENSLRWSPSLQE